MMKLKNWMSKFNQKLKIMKILMKINNQMRLNSLLNISLKNL